MASTEPTLWDEAEAELVPAVVGLYKTELIRGPAATSPWKTVDDVELVTLGWVQWHNTQRLHGSSAISRPPNTRRTSTLPDRATKTTLNPELAVTTAPATGGGAETSG